jgi:hypothetical protein
MKINEIFKHRFALSSLSIHRNITHFKSNIRDLHFVIPTFLYIVWREDMKVFLRPLCKIRHILAHLSCVMMIDLLRK